MPSGRSKVADITDIADMTEAELEKEFQEEEEADKEEEEEVKEELSGRRSQDRASRTSSTDRPSSSDSLKTTSDQQSEDTASSGDPSAMPMEQDKEKKHGPSVWQSFKRAGGELNQDTRRLFRYIGRKLHSRHGQRETKVKEIHILPGEDDDRMWARRMAGSATSRSSSSSDPST